MFCWRPSCMCPGRSRVLCRAGVWRRRWARAWRAGVCWYALQRDSAKRPCWPTGPAVAGGHSDPARFWRYAVAALDRARPGLAGRVGPLPSRSFEGLVTAVINELAADPGPEEALLVLDD